MRRVPQTFLFALTVAAATSLTAPGRAEAQNAQTRNGFWIQLGLGYGTLGCQDCLDREGGASGMLALGGTLNQHWLLGMASNAWTKSENNATLTVSTVTALVRFYPSVTSGFFLNGGVGVGRVEASASGFGVTFTASETGGGAMLGLGWDLRVGSNVSLTPFWNGFAMSSDNTDANVGQIGLAVTIH